MNRAVDTMRFNEEMIQLENRAIINESIETGICGFCGGKVNMSCFNGGDSWCIECSSCNYLFDED